jgi:hypothetical protein
VVVLFWLSYSGYSVLRFEAGEKRDSHRNIIIRDSQKARPVYIYTKVGIRNLSPQLLNIADNQIDCGVAD